MVPNIKSLIPVYIAGRPEPLPRGFRRVECFENADAVLCLFGWIFDPEIKRIKSIKSEDQNSKPRKDKKRTPVCMSFCALDVLYKVWALGMDKDERNAMPKRAKPQKHVIPDNGALAVDEYKEIMRIGIKYGPTVTKKMTAPYERKFKLKHKSVANIMRGTTHKKIYSDVMKELAK